MEGGGAGVPHVFPLNPPLTCVDQNDTKSLLLNLIKVMNNYKFVNFEEIRVGKGLIKNDIPVMIIIMITLVTSQIP